MAGLLEIEGVHTAYDKADVLEGVSLKIEPGRITCLLGSNGSGRPPLDPGADAAARRPYRI